MIYITGDTHAKWVDRFMNSSLPEKEMTREDYVIVCGDFGIWHNDHYEKFAFDWLGEKPFTLLFVDGNHENHDRLCSGEFEVVDFHGGRAHKIRKNIYHLMRGYVFELCGKKFFTFGGASSHDIDDGILDRDDYESDDAFMEVVREWDRQGKMYRINHVSWWKEELPTQEEMERGLQNLKANDYKVDYIITHTPPQIVNSYLGFKDGDVLTQYLNEVAEKTRFEGWWSGHVHLNQYSIVGKYNVIYKKITRIV